MFTEKKRGRPKGSKNKATEGQETASNIRIGAGVYHAPAPKPSIAYTYTPLAKTSLGNTELYSLYGIVIDATNPHPKKHFFR
jgi:hypothetical protein